MNELYLRPILVPCHAFNVMTMGDKSLLTCFRIVVFCLCSEQLVIPVFGFRGIDTTTQSANRLFNVQICRHSDNFTA